MRVRVRMHRSLSPARDGAGQSRRTPSSMARGRAATTPAPRQEEGLAEGAPEEAAARFSGGT